MNTREWINQLQQMIYTKIAPLAIPDNDTKRRIQLVNQEAMMIWVRAFTHKSFDPNAENNYELLEHLGDKAIGLAFDQYLINKFPATENEAAITESESSELITSYMSKQNQAEMSANLGLDNWVRTLFDKSMHVREDIFESMFGALIQIGDRVMGKGVGYVSVSYTHLTLPTIYSV